MASESTSPSLIDRLGDLDDHEAWREFEARYRELILRYAQRRGLQPADAEDVRQAVFVGLMASLKHFTYRPEVGRFRDYLGVVTRNAVARHRRGQDLAPGTLSTVTPELAASGDEDAWNEEWELHHYRRAMDTLRRTVHRGTLEIFEDLLEGRRPEEVAALRGVQIDSVYKAKQRVRDRLAELIREQLDDEEPRERRG